MQIFLLLLTLTQYMQYTHYVHAFGVLLVNFGILIDTKAELQGLVYFSRTTYCMIDYMTFTTLKSMEHL